MAGPLAQLLPLLGQAWVLIPALMIITVCVRCTATHNPGLVSYSWNNVAGVAPMVEEQMAVSGNTR
jgi:hypothetical protein